MSKFNSTRKMTTLKRSQVTVGEIAGQVTDTAAKQSNIQLLRRVTLANLLWEHNAYVDGQSVVDEITRLIPLCDPQDVANLAVECRTMQKLRHTPLFIAVQMCKHDETRPYVKDILPKIITRADMLTDFMARLCSLHILYLYLLASTYPLKQYILRWTLIVRQML